MQCNLTQCNLTQCNLRQAPGERARICWLGCGCWT
ncbi:pentapeptide repeat-containing protein [Kribbella albertanoniae]|uniref:Pentapeptide repeat-containing protein n=1 Tax=Kribbella albertanoniae TaxID=1266829 RepID=A0A4R4P3N3_9ACTN|nr:hypothetical protein E1261_42195 [Kribbella albertanoniae]